MADVTVDAGLVHERVGVVRSQLAELTDRPVTVVAVTKRFGPDAVAAALAAGLTDMGENRAQEMVEKVEACAMQGLDPTWHFVGGIQRNKVRSVAAATALWHSVDRVRIAAEIATRAPGAAVLLQVNVAGNEGQGGLDPAEVPAILAETRLLDLDIRGLMAIGLPGDPEDARPGFRLLRSLVDDNGLHECSMGMSGDWPVAVQEGATMIRIGSSLFGPRPA